MTVHQFKCAIEEMKKHIYNFDDKKATLCVNDLISREPNKVQVYTKDETTGIEIVMSKSIGARDYEELN